MSQPKKTQIEVRAPDAGHVFLAGSFNDWQPDALPMVREPDGTWHTRLRLRPGRHEYKFVVDGRWCCDPGGDGEVSDGRVPNPFGTMNRVIDVT